MTALAIIPKAPAPLPIPPPELAQKIATFDGMEIIRGQVPDLVIAQAKAHLAMLDAHHAPPPPARITLWCRELRKALAPIHDQEFDDRLAAFKTDFVAYPGWVWNEETLSLMRKKTRYFPTSFDIEEVFAPIIDRAIRGRAHVKLLAEAKAPPADEPVVKIGNVPAKLAAQMGRRE